MPDTKNKFWIVWRLGEALKLEEKIWKFSVKSEENLYMPKRNGGKYSQRKTLVDLIEMKKKRKNSECLSAIETNLNGKW